jgi:cytochrome P450
MAASISSRRIGCSSCSARPIATRPAFATPTISTSPRDTGKSIAFGAGPHYCAGAFASRAMVADVALPGIFARLKGLRLDVTEPVRIGGWAFRGLLNLPVTWEAG